jgi:hypothetical protein
MGRGIRAYRAALAAVLVSAGACSPAAPDKPADKPTAAAPAAAPSSAPVPPADPATAPLGQWLVGTWSFDTSCASDFLIVYEADGRLDNSGETGRWALSGDTLTETITEKLESGGDAPQKVDPPTTRRYTVARIDAGHGTILFQGKAVPVLRC